MGAGHLSGQYNGGFPNEASYGQYSAWDEFLYRAFGGGYRTYLLLWDIQMDTILACVFRGSNRPQLMLVSYNDSV